MTKSFDIDSELIRKLAQLLNETGLSEIEFESGATRIRVVRRTAPSNADEQTVQTTFRTEPPPVPEHTPPPQEESGYTITSPMVGTAYLAPEPGGTPYVEVGDIVDKNQIVLLIEAMKTFNPIRAPKGGTVRNILIEDSTPVEYGEELMILD